MPAAEIDGAGLELTPPQPRELVYWDEAEGVDL
jgi:hypothetical protein